MPYMKWLCNIRSTVIHNDRLLLFWFFHTKLLLL